MILKSESLYGTTDRRRTSLDAHDELSTAYSAMYHGHVGALSLQQGWLKEDTNVPQQDSSTNTKGTTHPGRVADEAWVHQTAETIPDSYELVPIQPEFSTTEEQDTHKPEPLALEEEDTRGHTIPLIEVNLI